MARSKLKRRAQREEARSGDLSGRLVTLTNPDSLASEAYRTLRTSLLFAFSDTSPRVITVTSPNSREGKSTTCANLGVVMAQANKNTLIVDCDLRKPVLHRTFGLRNLRGMVDVIVGERSLESAWQELLPNLKVMTVGTLPPTPAELLSSRRFAEFLSQARQKFDYVLLDSPPTQLVSDPMVIATQGDGVLLVVDAQSTRKVSVRQSVRSLEAVGVKILGTVMNNVKASETDQYGYAYYGGYTG